MDTSFKIKAEEVKADVVQRLQNGIDGRLYRIYKDYRISPYGTADIVLCGNDDKPVAVFDIKAFPQGYALRSRIMWTFKHMLKNQRVRYYVVTDGNDFWVNSSENDNPINLSFD